MASGDVWKVLLNWRWGTVECRPGFYLVEGAGGAGPNPSENVAVKVEAALGASGIDGFSDQSQITALTVIDIQPGLLPTQVWPVTPIVGTIVDANPLPPQSAAVVSLQTGVKGSVGVFAAQGRMYLPGIPQVGQISGFLQAAFQTALDAFVAQLFADFVTDGTAYQWHVVSLTPGSSPVSVRAINPVTGTTNNNVVRSQRRREYGVGI